MHISLERLGNYFSNETRESLETITTLEGSLEKEHESFLFHVKTQIDDFVTKLLVIQNTLTRLPQKFYRKDLRESRHAI